MTQLQSFLEKLHHTYSSLEQGQVAAYIPELSKANPDWFGISIVTTDGQLGSRPAASLTNSPVMGSIASNPGKLPLAKQ